MIGKKIWAEGIVGVYDSKLDKLCIEDVKSWDGFERDHIWVAMDRRLRPFKKGDKIEFTALVYEYVGLNEKEEQVKKMGLMNLRNVRGKL